MPRADLVVSRDSRSLRLGHEDQALLQYVLVRRRGRRGVGLKVDEQGLTVSAPVGMPLARVEDIVRGSQSWIVKKVREWSLRRVPELVWEDGAVLSFLGAPLVLRVAQGARSRVVRDGAQLQVWAPEPQEAALRRLVTDWYKRAAREHLGARVEALCAAAGIAPPRLFISPARARWGSCNSRREVRLAWRLVKAPPELVDYVVCHELAHLKHMDHSPAFWAEVERQCPDYRALRARLFATDYLYRSF